MSTSSLRLLAFLSVSAIALSGCGGLGQGKTESIPAATVTVTQEATTPAAESSAPESSAPESSVPESSAAPTASASASATPRELVKHDPKLKQLSAKWVKADVLPGWTGKRRAVAGNQPDLYFQHTASKSSVQLVGLDDISIKGSDIGPANAGMCGALVQTRSENFKPGWTEGPHDTLAMPAGLHGYSCGIKGVLAQEGPLQGKKVEMVITSIAKDNGEATIQISTFPVEGNEDANAAAGVDAAYLLRQVVLNWTGKTF